MKDIVFYQGFSYVNLGITSINSCLRKSGFSSDVIVESMESDAIQALKELNPRLIGISIFTVEYPWLIKTIEKIHHALPDVPIIVGGIHAVIYPEMVLDNTSASLVCHSDGEEVLVNVLKEMRKTDPDWSSVIGIGYKDKEGKVHINERAMLYQYHNDIIEDRSIYFDRYNDLAKDGEQPFIATRGCPYSCSFCYNSYLRKIVSGKGKFLRQKSPDNLLEEISGHISKYGNIRIILFADDLFAYDVKWLGEFLPQYKKNINLPFMCTSRADGITEDRAKMLSEAGCRTIFVGIESGNEKIRNVILEKRITDEDIIRCSEILRKYNITMRGMNMFCLPDETVESAMETIELNIKAKIKYAFSFLFLPFPDTKIFDYCKKKNLVGDDYSLHDIPASCLKTSVLKIKDKKTIINIHYLCYFFVRYPWTFRSFKNIVRLEMLNGLFYYVYLLGSLARHKEERGLGWFSTIRFAIKMRDRV